MVDWDALGSVLTGIGTIAGAGAIVVAAYRAEEAIEGMRARWMPAAELNATEEQLKELGMKLDGMLAAEKSAHISRGVIYRRAEYFKEDFEVVFEAIPRVRALFGKDIAHALKAFPRARNRILSSSDMLPMITRDGDADKNTSQSIRRDIYGKWQENDPDPIAEMISEALATLEGQLLPKIRPVEDGN